jgi:O-methyltransferase involved in polyketide biosynthesis
LSKSTRKYNDTYAQAFIAENRAGLVVSLGCGFDTRYWRVSENAWKYIEVEALAHSIPKENSAER